METSSDQAPEFLSEQSHQHSLDRPIVAEHIRTRCPSCQKLYATDRPTDSTEQIRFECTWCTAEFALEMPLNFQNGLARSFMVSDRTTTAAAEMRDAAMTVPFMEAELETKAIKPNLSENERIAEEFALGSKPELALLWKQTVADYADEFLHDAFVSACSKAGALPYAAQKYNRILQVNPEDEIARKMRARIIAIVSAPATVASRGRALPSFRLPRLNTMVILLGSVVFFVGMMLPHSGKMAGVGLSMVALAIGLRVFSNHKVS